MPEAATKSDEPKPPHRVLICDDSGFARKQMARALPNDWGAEIHFAGNGREGLAAIRAGKGHLVFLDLNMPDMDGYQVLQAVQQEGLPSRIIVVSGDIQPEARVRVMGFGALDFIRKPVSGDEITAILNRLGLWRGPTTSAPAGPVEIDVMDGLREVANVAMGRAADLLARLLEVFVVLPVPRVNLLETGELQMALHHAAGSQDVSAVCQGFIGGGIAGEALLLFHESSYTDLAALLHYKESLDQGAKVELLVDTASLLIGACLKGLADQMDISFSQSHPMLLGRHASIPDLVRRNAESWSNILTIDLGFTIEKHNISANLLLLFTDASLASLERRISYQAV
jgi:CheY-like chemotaxis protein